MSAAFRVQWEADLLAAVSRQSGHSEAWSRVLLEEQWGTVAVQWLLRSSATQAAASVLRAANKEEA